MDGSVALRGGGFLGDRNLEGFWCGGDRRGPCDRGEAGSDAADAEAASARSRAFGERERAEARGQRGGRWCRGGKLLFLFFFFLSFSLFFFSSCRVRIRLAGRVDGRAVWLTVSVEGG